MPNSRLGALTLLFKGLILTASAQAASTGAIAPAQQHRQLEAVRELERVADALMRTGEVTGLASTVVQGGRVLHLQGRGVRNIYSYEPVTPDSVFRLASLSKGFASTLSAKLVEENALDWRDRVQDYLPAFKLKDMQSAANLSIEDLLAQRSGLPMHAFDRNLERDVPVHELVDQLATVNPVCRAGECYGYQNVAFNLIHDVTFAATGKFFYQQVESRLFHPLGMRNATYGREALERSAEYARPHVLAGGRWITVTPNDTYYRVPAAAGANASIRDVSQWMLAQLGHRPEVLSKELLADLHRPRVLTPYEMRGSKWRRERLTNAHYALGWRVYDYLGHPVIYHAGAVRGYRGVIAMLPEQDFGLALLWNCESNAPAGLIANTFDRLLGIQGTDWVEVSKYTRRATAAKSR